MAAYKTLCRPILEYAAEVWDPHTEKDIYLIEMVQNKAVRFIKNLKGIVSVTVARESLGLELLESRRKTSRINLLTTILGSDGHSFLSNEFSDLMVSHVYGTRSSSKGLPRPVHTNLNLFYHSFIPRTARDLRLGAT